MSKVMSVRFNLTPWRKLSEAHSAAYSRILRDGVRYNFAEKAQSAWKKPSREMACGKMLENSHCAREINHRVFLTADQLAVVYLLF